MQLLDDDGDERVQFAAGEPLTVRLRLEAEEEVASRVRLELRDDGGLTLGATEHDLDSFAGARELRLRLPRLPLADGRFHLRVDDSDGHTLHTHDDALRFFVFPTGAQSGAVLLEGDWSLQEIDEGAPIPRA